MHLALSSPSPKLTIVPSFTLFAGLTKHFQLSFSILFRRSTSMTAPVSILSPINLAGNTLVSFSTKTSPLFK